MTAVLSRSVTTQEIEQLTTDSDKLENLVNKEVPKRNPKASKVISHAHGRSYSILSGDAVVRIDIDDIEDDFLYTVLDLFLILRYLNCRHI